MTVSLPYEIAEGDTTNNHKIQANFDELLDALNTLSTTVTTLQTTINTLSTTVTTLQTTINNLETRDCEVDYFSAGDSSFRSTTNTSYEEQGDLTLSVTAKAGDVIRVDLQGQFYNTSASCISYITGSGNLSSLSTTGYIMTNSHSYPGFSGSVSHLYKCTSDGTLTFKMWWKASGGGTSYCRYRNLKAYIIGSDS